MVLMTTGVHIDADTTLNRPLTEGEGTRVASQLTWPNLGQDVTLVALGVATMDGDLPIPGATWPREVLSFVEAACASARVSSCNVLQVAPVDEALL